MKNIYIWLSLSFSMSFTFFACEKKADENKSQDKITIEKRDSLYIIKAFDQEMMINANNGARILSFRTDKREIIGPGGSTFWTSPQSSWSWPPVKAHHDLPYTGEIKGDTLILKSGKDTQLGVEITKTIIPHTKDMSFRVIYTITNQADSSIKLAPWENTRGFKKALIFYPKGETDSTAYAEVMGDLKLTHVEGINWFVFDSSRILHKPMAKLFADGAEGWIAQTFNQVILIKKFKDIPRAEQAPGEGEIEIWSDFENAFSEIEQQGSYTTLLAGQSLTWEVKWYLRKLPDNIQAQEGNKALVDFARQTIK